MNLINALSAGFAVEIDTPLIIDKDRDYNLTFLFGMYSRTIIGECQPLVCSDSLADNYSEFLGNLNLPFVIELSPSEHFQVIYLKEECRKNLIADWSDLGLVLNEENQIFK